MALVRQLVQLMGGSVLVHSKAGAGTTVQVELPRPRSTDVPPEPSKAPALPVSDQPVPELAPSGLVLYIEDNPVNVLIVKNVLRRWPDVRFVVAEDGASGLGLAAALCPDVVLLDMRLPDMSGLDVLKALRADAATRDLPVIALSASAMPREVSLAMAAGAQDYWTKPIDVASFCRGMAQLLRGRPGR